MRDEKIRYSILDPTGNITALVETEVEISRQPDTAAAIMRQHPEVEQVGFVSFPESISAAEPAENTVALRMAGGEFCGNAAMSTAALYLLHSCTGRAITEAVPAAGRTDRTAEIVPQADPLTVYVKVSGAGKPVEVKLWRETDTGFRAGVRMPHAIAIEEKELNFENMQKKLPVVKMEGISHIVIESGSGFFVLKDKRERAELAVKKWCEELKAEGLGIMFLDMSGGDRAGTGIMTPLVYIPGSGTVFWENSCASGTSAVGMYLAEKREKKIAETLLEPGGELRVESDPAKQETWLYGKVNLRERSPS